MREIHKRKKKKEKTRARRMEAMAKGWEINDFVERLSQVFSNKYVKLLQFLSRIIELALSIILKERELYESKHVTVECRCLKIRDLLSFLICFSILVLKWQQVLELQLAQVNLCTREDFKSSGTGSLYQK